LFFASHSYLRNSFSILFANVQQRENPRIHSSC
jgi:hypothetical protein